jgi:hypothetical protein
MYNLQVGTQDEWRLAMGIKRLLAAGACALILSSWGCAGGPKVYPSLGSSIYPGWNVVYRPVLHPEKTWQSIADDIRRDFVRTPSDILQFTDQTIPLEANLYGDRIEMRCDRNGREERVTIHLHQLVKTEFVLHQQGKGGGVHLPLPNGMEFVSTLDKLKRVADDLFFLQNHMRQIVALEEAKQVQFKPVAEKYRALAVKPPLSEEMRRLIIQAEALREERKYAQAIAHYGKITNVDLAAYPEAYYNQALLSEQLNQILPAIYYMKFYLQLVPDGPDARAARDKIYALEMKMGGN